MAGLLEEAIQPTDFGPRETKEHAAAPQLLFHRVTLAEVAHHSGKALHFPVFASEGHRKHVRPKSSSVYGRVPSSNYACHEGNSGMEGMLSGGAGAAALKVMG